MSGQIFSVNAEGGFLYSDELSDVLRQQVQPYTKFRQLCDAKDGSKKQLHRGASFQWNVYTNVATQGRRLDETTPIPETGFTLSQKSLTIQEAGNSVPYTQKLSDLGKQDVVTIIDQALKEDCRKYFDIEAFLQFNATVLRASSASSATAITLDTNGVASQSNNVAFGTGHVKAIVDTMKERNIPPYRGDDYVAIGHVTTFRNFRNQMETLNQYTDTGMGFVYSGEMGRYEGTRFIEQNFIPKGGAADTTTFDPWTGTADPWNNAVSSWVFFMGSDTVTEAQVVPEEVRAKLPGDFGRAKAIAWYYLGGFGLIHDDATNARIVKWDSAV